VSAIALVLGLLCCLRFGAGIVVLPCAVGAAAMP